MKLLLSYISRAASEGYLLPSTVENIRLLLEEDSSSLTSESVAELVKRRQWKELNDRFFCMLHFGTGGLRGNTIRSIVTHSEQGASLRGECPQFPSVGTNMMNDFNITKVTKGLAEYVKEVFSVGGQEERPKICIAYDTRYFSRRFAELCARTCAEKGCDALVFSSPRSAPELSFAVRYLHAAAGVNITASHNPPEYNGFKVYWTDGGQVMEPHASRIIQKVRQVLPWDTPSFYDEGEVVRLGAEIDLAYLERLQTLILDQELVARQAAATKIVYTPLYGTGMAIIPHLLRKFGFSVSIVEAQRDPDGQFPTVASPNPEEPAALNLAIEDANRLGAEVAIGTDPDGDRMGVAARDEAGEMRLLTGNQIGVLLLWYRITKLFELGVLNVNNLTRAACLKSFVTSDLQKAICRRFGVRCVETLTGFKYIGAKLHKYEEQIPADKRAGYTELSEQETRVLRLSESTYYIFGGEESHGYSASDFVRDKDANGSALLFAELVSYARERSITVHEILDEIFRTYGLYLEQTVSMPFEGAEGASKIQDLVSSYAACPPKSIAGSLVTNICNFAKETVTDAEGDIIPKTAMIAFETEDHSRVIVRPSGTEPKIKFYLSATCPSSLPSPTEAGDELSARKAELKAHLDAIWEFLSTDAQRRLLQKPL
ncbi:MAG: phospho-sugar mutase [Candidatus Xiphinematobacter sp.]|nr:MAG: phospho-sugar mutase [Candidatus Xiphinematobacter sp.]QQY10290.1 MAG: phospho-sugar mutase [Candidatus Xiphinematobacter sp.]